MNYQREGRDVSVQVNISSNNGYTDSWVQVAQHQSGVTTMYNNAHVGTSIPTKRIKYLH
jgi:hypothetical protein